MAAAAAPAFALFPGRANADPLDFNDSDDVKLYKTATAAMTTPYNLAPIGLTQFLSNVQDRSTEFGWGSLLKVPTGAPPVTRNIITDYGLITMADCDAHATTYYTQATREAQNSAMLYTYLSKSLTEEARMLVFAFKGDFMKNAPAPINDPVGIGILLLKTIIGKAVVDSAATVDTLRNSIASLDSKMVDLQSNVKQFNLHVINVRNGLVARGELVPELITNLFKAYAKASDEDFVDYMKTKKYSHFDGTTNESADTLMAKALAHYEASVERGTWNAPNEKDAKIIALAAENAKLKRTKKNERSTDAPAPAGDTSNKNAWKKVKPKSGETTKVIGDVTWNWCKHHKAWVRHSASDCYLDPVKKKETGDPPKIEPKMQLDPAFQGLLDDDENSQA